MSNNEIAKSLMSEYDKIKLENQILMKPNQVMIDLLHKEVQEVKPILNKEREWIDRFIKERHLEDSIELLLIHF